ncbi:MAG: glycerophosphodiester phosphodiesterase [Rubrivivax sp.]|nr:glycerophosphodiester phosphodiesterase [Rubrivivax sp.]
MIHTLLCRGLVAALALAAFGVQAFDAQGHRGARGLLPENSLPGFEQALAIGVHTLELDVGVTADGVVVISHDRTLNPAIVRDATGRWISAPGPTVRSLTLAQLQAYDVGRIDPASPYARTFAQQQPRDGTRMPTLAALFDRVKALGGTQVRFNIETKLSPLRPEETLAPEPFAQALLTLIREAGMASRVTIQSFDWRTLQAVQKLAPTIPTSYLTDAAMFSAGGAESPWTAGLRLADHGSLPRMVKAAGGAVWSPNAGTLTPALLQEAQSLGLKVIPWTVNNAADMERLIAMGVDGLITDYPDRLREVMTRRGMALPAPVAAR